MATAEQKAIAFTYRDAALEHVTVANELYGLNRFVLSSYVAGLSVECILRAYRYMKDPEFDSRHDIKKLLELAKFVDLLPPHRAEDVGASLGRIVNLWSNDYRFLTEAALRKRWTKRRLYEGIKGDFVKELVRLLVNAASEVVAIGVAQWKTSFKD